MPNLVPVELITDILCRLPVKSLLRFRCLSKPWCSEIDGPDFIKLHLKINTNLSFILSDTVDIFSIDFNTLDTAVKLNNRIADTAVKLNNPIANGRVMGSCNGLVALFNYHHQDMFNYHHQDMALWNPSTTRYHKLPVTASPIEFLGCFSEVIGYGFGYDPVSDDYKLVRIVLHCCWDDLKVIKSQVEVYSLKSNSWRQTRDFPSCQCYGRPGNGALVNNTLHWKITTKSERGFVNLIVAFDLRVEEYFEVPQPDYMDNRSFIWVGSLGGCLCLLCGHDAVSVDIRVMKEYGVKESWVKLFSMAKTGVIVKPLVYSKSGDRVLLDQYDDDDGKFVWYDLRGGRAEEIRIQAAPKSFDVKICVASLVPLSSGSGTNAMKQQALVKKKKKSSRKKRCSLEPSITSHCLKLFLM